MYQTVITHLEPTANPWMLDPNLQRVVRLVQGRFVGGCVRNSLLRIPISDIDIASPLTPVQIIDLFQGYKNIEIIPTGLLHGTVTIVWDGVPYEVTTLRRDVTTDGRHAEVAFTDSWEEDSCRRDLTINAIYMDADGRLYDYHNGMLDVDQGNIRFVGVPDERVTEDYLRILRFFRFQAYYGKTSFDKVSIDACRKHKDGLKKISRERINKEIIKTFQAPRAAHVIKVMHVHGILPLVLGFDPIQLGQLDRIYHAYQVLQLPVDPMMVIASLLENKKQIDTVHDHLMLSRADHRRLETIFTSKLNVTAKHMIRDLYVHGRDEWKQRMIWKWIADPYLLHDHEWLAWYNEAGKFMRPNSPVTGKKLLKLGIPSGKRMGLIMKDFDNWWIDNNFTKNLDLITVVLYGLIVRHQEPKPTA